jgi:hypothetical protein
LPGQRLSYQYHYKRQEAWTIVQGTAKIILDSVCNPNALFYSIEYFNNSNPRYESLSFPGLIYIIGVDTSSFFTVISLVVSGVFFFQFFKNSDINIFKLLKYVSLVLLFSFIFAKQAFGNYYLLL